MLHHYIRTATPLLLVAEHTLIIYLFLIASLRLLGFRQMGQLTAMDLLVIILLGSAVETAMVAGNTSLAAGLVSASTLFVTNRALTALTRRSKRVRLAITGGPTILVHYGKFIEDHLRRRGLTHEDVMEGIRERGLKSLDEVKFAVQEMDGTINVVPRSAKSLRTKRSIRPGAGTRDGGMVG